MGNNLRRRSQIQRKINEKIKLRKGGNKNERKKNCKQKMISQIKVS